MKSIHCIWVGKLKTPFWRDAAAHYLKGLGRFYRVVEKTVKDAPASASQEKRCLVEGERIMSCITPSDAVVALDVQGRAYSSPELASFLKSLTEDANRTPCFLIGGAYGLSEEVLRRSNYRISLSLLTFPHEMARVMLLEQLYRAASIVHGSPYHHE